MEIKFRGRNLQNGQWEHGQYHTYGDGKFIARTELEPNGGMDWKARAVEVDPASIGQFIGMVDRNGKEIYEGDQLTIQYFKGAIGPNMGFMEVEAELTGVVRFDGLTVQLMNIVGSKWEEYTGFDPGYGSCKLLNLHDVYEGSTDAEWQIEITGTLESTPATT